MPEPDYRHVERGKEWLRKMIEEVRSEKDAERVIAEMGGHRVDVREREVGEEGEEG